MSQPPWPPRIGEVSNGHQWNGTQWVPLTPEVGQIVNGHRWDGRQWVPLAQPTPRIGEVANGYQWNGTQWVPVPQPPQLGQVANGHRWDGRQWVPLGPPPPRVGEVVNGHQWNGTQWVPVPQQPQVGQIVNGYRWDGRQWVPLAAAGQQEGVQSPQPAQPAQAVPAAAAPLSTPAQAAAPVVMLIPELRRLADAWQFEWSQKGDLITMQRVIAEQKAFMATSRLEYHARIQVGEAQREVRFGELLMESGAGPTSGEEDTVATGFGVQRTSYNTATDDISEAIEQQAARFGQKYPLDFRFDLVRDQVRTAASVAGYGFRYGLL